MLGHNNPADLTVFQDMESNVRSYCRAFPTVFSTALGDVLHDEGGREYVDFFSGAGTLNYGHNNPRLKSAVIEYLSSDGVMHALDMATSAKRRFLERFWDVILRPRGLDYRVQFSAPTGADAVEAAIKAARLSTGRREIVCFSNGFHGMTLGALALTNNPHARKGAGVPLDNTVVVPYDGFPNAEYDSVAHLSATLEVLANRDALPAAIIFETVQAEGGINAARYDWMRAVADLAKKHGAALIIDDIQTGCGRTGPFLSFEPAGIEPDFVCLSKSLSGLGLPLACVLIRPDRDVWAPAQHTGTFRGNNLAFVAAAEALGFWEDDSLSRAIETKARRMRERLEAIAAGAPREWGLEVRGRGLMQGLAGPEPEFGPKLARECFARGLIIESAGRYDEVLKLLPPLTLSDDALEFGLDTIEAVVEVTAAAG